MPIFRKYRYSNIITLKLCKTSGSIHLFKLTGSINKENIKLHKNTIWDVIEIDWSNIKWERN